MDALAIILRFVREQVAVTGVPPDALQDALAEAEHRARRTLGGSHHHISRVPDLPTKARIIDLHGTGITAQQAADRLGVTDRWVQKVWQQIRPAD